MKFCFYPNHGLQFGGRVGPNVVIVTTGMRRFVRYWRRRLERLRGVWLQADVQILVVHEEWPAGTALGTLDAYRKLGLDGFLEEGKAVFLYHAAGRGSRLEPLTTVAGCKAAVTLPVTFGGEPLTLLEAVIIQTSALASMRLGRLSVFWVDQLFVPELPLHPPRAHADLMVALGKELVDCESYGYVAISREGRVQCVEKVTRKRFDSLGLCCAGGRGPSLGNFSVSLPFLRSLNSLLESELMERSGSWDVDPCWWMPLSLDERTYCALRGDAARWHYERMGALRECGPLLEVSDVGAGCYWWDFGRLESYYENVRKFSLSDAESCALRGLFFDQE